MKNNNMRESLEIHKEYYHISSANSWCTSSSTTKPIRSIAAVASQGPAAEATAAAEIPVSATRVQRPQQREKESNGAAAEARDVAELQSGCEESAASSNDSDTDAQSNGERQSTAEWADLLKRD